MHRIVFGVRCCTIWLKKAYNLLQLDKCAKVVSECVTYWWEFIVLQTNGPNNPSYIHSTPYIKLNIHFVE